MTIIIFMQLVFFNLQLKHRYAKYITPHLKTQGYLYYVELNGYFQLEFLLLPFLLQMFLEKHPVKT